MISIEEFCDKHGASEKVREWAFGNCRDMPDAWQKLRPDGLVWVATRSGVLTNQELRFFAVFCARQVEYLLVDERSKHAIEVAERFANGEATSEELDRARAAAGAAWKAAWAADWDADWDAHEVADAAYAAYAAAAYAAYAAAAGAAVAAYAAARAAAAHAAHAANAAAVRAADWDAARAAQADWLRKNAKPNFGVEIDHSL